MFYVKKCNIFNDKIKLSLLLILCKKLNIMLETLDIKFPFFCCSGLTTVGMGVANVFMTLVSLALIEKAGRRVLHLTGLAGMCVCAIALVVSCLLKQ